MLNVRPDSPYIAWVLFLFSLIVRACLITNGPYHGDCLALAVYSDELLDTGHLPYLLGSGYPLTIILGAIFVGMARFFSMQDPIVPFNFMSVVFGSASVPLFYYLALKFTDKISALLGAILFSLSPIFLGISVYGNSHAPAMFFLLASINGLLCYPQTQQTKYFWLSAISWGLLGGTRLQDFILTIPAIGLLGGQNLLTVHKFPHSLRNIFAKLGLFFIIAGCTAFLFYAPYLTESRRAEYLSQLTFYKTLSLSPGIISQTIPVLLDYFVRNFSILGLLCAFIGFLRLWHNNRSLIPFLLIWIFVPFCAYPKLINLSSRFLTFILPPFYIALGCFVGQLWQLNKKWRLWAIGATLLILLFPTVHSLRGLAQRHRYALLPDYVRWVDRMTLDNALILCTDERRFFQYYGHRQILGRPLREEDFDETKLEEFKSELQQLIKKGVPVYVIYTSIFAYDPDKKFSTSLIKNFQFEFIGKYPFENWHMGELYIVVYLNPLYRLHLKDTGQNS